MARHNLSGMFRETFPQELIDFILGKADKETLNSCALVAKLFRKTSQKLIFSVVMMLPPGRDNIPTLQRLADVLSASPSLALHVRTLYLVQPGFYQQCVWMQSDILPAILSRFTNLESLNIEIYNWNYFHSNCEQAIHALITRSSLSSIEVKEARLQNASLLSLLGCLPPSLESASFSDVFADSSSFYDDDLQSTSAELHKLRLASLHLHSYAPMLFCWVNRAVDPECLRRLHTMVEENTLHVVQQLLDSAVDVETYHLFFWSIFSHPENLDLQKMQGLRTLEISVKLDWEEIEEVEGQGRHNPLDDAMRTLETAPRSVEHLVLNLSIWDPANLCNFTESMSFEHLEHRPGLRDVVVRITSRYNDNSALQRGIRHLEAVFHRLHKKGMLTVIAVRPPSQGDNCCLRNYLSSMLSH
ncbi:hypothetical protein C8R45DRAFT_446630 [Mycena sanguinolenta]|nr:hypothetical protein C8R45DRAFT_446630 [Mycena sanguinolenta]